MKNILFIGTSKSPLSIERYNLIKDHVKYEHIYFYDLAKNMKEFIYIDISKGKLQHIIDFIHIVYIIKKLKITHLHYHGANHLFVNFAPLLYKNLCVIVTVQGSEINDAYNGKNKLFVDYLLKDADIITVKSNFLKSKVKSIIKKSSNLVNLNWGIDENLFNMQKNNQSKTNKINIISFRGSTYPYNIDIVFQAIKRLKENFKNINFTYVEFNKTSDVILDMNIVDKHYKELSKNKLFEILKEQDIMISIPSYDGFATSIMESLALGVLPVISDLPSYKKENLDSVVEKIENIDSISLYSKISEILTDNLTIYERSKRALFAMSHYGREKQIKILKDLYENCGSN